MRVVRARLASTLGRQRRATSSRVDRDRDRGRDCDDARRLPRCKTPMMGRDVIGIGHHASARTHPSPLIRRVTTRHSDPVARAMETREGWCGWCLMRGGVRGGSRLVSESQAWVFFFIRLDVSCVRTGVVSRTIGRGGVYGRRRAFYGCRTHRKCPFEGMFFHQTRSVGRSVVSVVSVGRARGRETRRQSSSVGRRRSSVGRRSRRRVVYRVIH